VALLSLLKPLNPRIESWANKRVWIIGASSGIGLATAQALAQAGAKVVVSARKRAPLDEFVAQHSTALALALDVNQADAWQGAVESVMALGALDVVMYCAGTYQAMRATDFKLDVALAHNQTNYIGALYMLGALLPSLLRQAQAGQSAHISLVSSVAGFRALPQSLAYGPTKAALTHLAEGMYLDLREQGLGVSVIHPGFIETPLTAQNHFAMPALMKPEQAAQKILQGWSEGLFDIHFPKRFTRWLKLLRLLPYRLYFFCVSRFTGL
jgi:NAD(P)-dependent dehydrogenase (short-subunit alcohol dehydrogenase family)